MSVSLESIAVLIGALGGFELIKWSVSAYTSRRSNKRKENAEADKAESDADAAIVHLYEERLKELRASNSELNTQLLTCTKEKARKEEIIDDKTAQIRKVNEELIAATRHIGHLEKELQYFKNWKCFREYGKGKNECTRREPQQNPPLKYHPMTEEEQ